MEKLEGQMTKTKLERGKLISIYFPPPFEMEEKKA